jgi:YD repeat-containing protein
MSTEHDLQECQKCGTATTAGATHCPNCGYGFSSGREGEGPLSFAFPAVENAYKPSGKGSPKAILLMLAMGLPVAAVGGVLLYPVHAIIATLASKMPVCLIVLAALVLYFIVAGVLGYLIGLSVGKGGLIGKNRNLRAAWAIGLLCGLVGYGAYVAVYFSVLGPKGFNSAIDAIKLIGYFLAIVLVAGATSGGTVEENPFCERCEEYMRKISLGKYPIRLERVWIGLLNSRKFDGIGDLASDSGRDSKDFTEVTVWHCDSCKEAGFINAETTQVRYEYDKQGNKTTKSETRRIFSSPIVKSEIATLVARADVAM